MAEGGIPPNKRNQRKARINQVCRYFIHGACKKGDDCNFLHDKSRALPTDNVCRYYQFGKCSYGKECRYEHVKTNKSQPDRPPHTSNTQYAQDERQTDHSSRASKMITLKKGGFDKSLKESQNAKSKADYHKQWVKAKDFVPGRKFYGSAPSSYASAVQPQSHMSEGAVGGEHIWQSEMTEDSLLCPYEAQGSCLSHLQDRCGYVHAEICDICGIPALHPVNLKQREQHVKECIAEHEKMMEAAFAMQASENKQCGICLETILDKHNLTGAAADKRFGILESCNHVFCLPCIRQWRNNKSASIETHKACPTCRTHSDFVTPSKYWIECPQQKAKLIEDYKKALSHKPCAYFKKGKGICPFDEKCFYKHALENGTIVKGNVLKRRRRVNADGENSNTGEISLWDFFENRDEYGGLSLNDELSLVLLGIFQDSSDEEDFNASLNLRYNFLDEDFLFTDSEPDSDFRF